jgi:hypothetical protein
MPPSRTEYLAANLTRPIPTKDRGVLRTVADARDYMVALPNIANPSTTGRLWGRPPVRVLS